MIRYPASAPQQTPYYDGYDANSIMVHAQPMRDIENGRFAPPQFNLVGPNQCALIYVSDRPMNSAISDVLAARPAPTAPRFASPAPAQSAAVGTSALQKKIIGGFLGGCVLVGAGAAAYREMHK